MTQFPQETFGFTAISANYTANPGDQLNVTAAALVTVTLPPVGTRGPVGVRKVDTAAFGVKLVTADGSTIDGVAGATGITTAATQHAGFTVASDGSNWYVVGS